MAATAGPVHPRRARAGRGDQGHLPSHDHRLPRTRPHPRPRADADTDRIGQPGRASSANRDHHARPDPQKRAADVLAYFDRPGTSNGPTEAINRRLEHLRGSALGFRNLTNYITRSPTRDRRLQRPTTPWNVKSRLTLADSVVDVPGCRPPSIRACLVQPRNASDTIPIRGPILWIARSSTATDPQPSLADHPQSSLTQLAVLTRCWHDPRAGIVSGSASLQPIRPTSRTERSWG